MEWLESLSELDEGTLAMMIPIIAIVSVFLVGGILGLTKLIFRHRERMAMIERGMHPDLVEPEEDESVVPPIG
jgi:hypothetical protein